MTTHKAAPPRMVDDYLALPYTLRITPDPHGGYVGVVEELPGCITQGESWAEMGDMLRDAMRAWITVALEDGRPVPLPKERGEAARFLLRLPQTLYHDLQRAAEREGVSLNQYLVYRLALGSWREGEPTPAPAGPADRNRASRGAVGRPGPLTA
jgi:antitoxin HicB